MNENLMRFWKEWKDGGVEYAASLFKNLPIKNRLNDTKTLGVSFLESSGGQCSDFGSLA